MYAGRRASLAEQAGESNNGAPTGKWLHMMGKRRTDKCAKCKTKPDTVHYTLNGCPCMMGLYIRSGTISYAELGTSL